MSKPNNPHIAKACEIVGSQSEVAKLLGVPPAAVNQWVKGLRPVPDKHALAIEQATSGKVTRKELCPDDWQRYWPELQEPTHA